MSKVYLTLFCILNLRRLEKCQQKARCQHKARWTVYQLIHLLCQCCGQSVVQFGKKVQELDSLIQFKFICVDTICVDMLFVLTLFRLMNLLRCRIMFIFCRRFFGPSIKATQMNLECIQSNLSSRTILKKNCPGPQNNSKLSC